MNTSLDHEIPEKARAFAVPLLDNIQLPTGESVIQHADEVSSILREIDGSEEMQAGVYLAFACDQLNKPKELISSSFDSKIAALAIETQRIFQLQRQAISSAKAAHQPQSQIENVRRMLLAFSRDLRVVILLMASQLQNLRFLTSRKLTGFELIANETIHVISPLANRLGIWQLKWEMEDLAFRMLEPKTYKEIANLLDIKRHERELEVSQMREIIQSGLEHSGVVAEVQARAKHIYSIAKKMRGKSLSFDQILDLRALRIIVDSVQDCYQALAWVHSEFQLLNGEYDDYIARPKPNGYQSLHTVVKDESGKVFELQIRTRAMHEHAEFGVAAHWAYKEAGVKGYSGISASAEQSNKIAVLRQLLAWERDLSDKGQLAHAPSNESRGDEKIYVLTPDASIVELPVGSTPIDFAYTLHTDLGHRCRGAKVDGVLVPLNTALKNGQTIEITAAKEGGPSRDWLNHDLSFTASSRAKSKIRAWFNAQKTAQTIARGRELVEKLLQREGRTAYKLEDLAKHLGFDSATQLFEIVGKDEYSLKHIESLLHPVMPSEASDEQLLKKVNKTKDSSIIGSVLVVGVDSLLTQLAKCCRPAPPDLVKGFVTRGKGVSVHRITCSNFSQLALCHPGRVIEVAWGNQNAGQAEARYPVDIQVLANDRQGLLRDISEILAKERMNVIGVQTHSLKETAWMTFTIEIPDSSRLNKVLSLINDISGVQSARRLGV